MMRIKKNDTVIVLAGKDRGKKGLVIEVDAHNNKVKVQDVGVVTRHYRARRRGEASQVKRIETAIDMSNVMLFDKAADRPCRVNFVVAADGAKIRVSNATKQAI